MGTKSLLRTLNNQHGAAMIEYALVAAVMMMAIIPATTHLHYKTRGVIVMSMRAMQGEGVGTEGSNECEWNCPLEQSGPRRGSGRGPSGGTSGNGMSGNGTSGNDPATRSGNGNGSGGSRGQGGNPGSGGASGGGSNPGTGTTRG